MFQKVVEERIEFYRSRGIEDSAVLISKVAKDFDIRKYDVEEIILAMGCDTGIGRRKPGWLRRGEKYEASDFECCE